MAATNHKDNHELALMGPSHSNMLPPGWNVAVARVRRLSSEFCPETKAKGQRLQPTTWRCFMHTKSHVWLNVCPAGITKQNNIPTNQCSSLRYNKTGASSSEARRLILVTTNHVVNEWLALLPASYSRVQISDRISRLRFSSVPSGKFQVCNETGLRPLRSTSLPIHHGILPHFAYDVRWTRQTWFLLVKSYGFPSNASDNYYVLIIIMQQCYLYLCIFTQILTTCSQKVWY